MDSSLKFWRIMRARKKFWLLPVMVAVLGGSIIGAISGSGMPGEGDNFYRPWSTTRP